MRGWFISLFPAAKREWAEMLAAEDAAKTTILRALVAAWCLTLEGGPMMRTVLMTLSAVNAIAGALLAGMWAFTEDVPTPVLVLALGLVAQGGYTLWFLLDDGRSSLAENLLLVGETLALLVGGGGLLVSVVNGIGAIDPEYGPMAVAGLIGTHAASALYLYAIRRGSIAMAGPNS